MKKVTGLVAAGAMLLAFAAPAFAFWHPYRGGSVTVINKGYADQTTVSVAVANTGVNAFDGGMGSWSYTGDANASSYAGSNANVFTTRVWDCSMCSSSRVFVLNGGSTNQLTISGALSNTGVNGFDGGRWSGSHTGNAKAVSGAESWANFYTTNIVR